MRNKTYFNDLLVESNIKQALTELLALLGDSDQTYLHDSMILLSGRFNRNEKDQKGGLIDLDDYRRELNRITNALKSYLDEIQFSDNGSTANPTTSPIDLTKSIFISYNHKDKEIANAVREKLESQNISVTIDSRDMDAGEDIKVFINNSIKETQVTLSIVSTNSLMSSWVSMESALTLAGEKIANKKFIAAFIDGSFFERDFVDNALNKVALEIEAIQGAIRKRMDKDRKINDLQTELERYRDLEHNLPVIIDKLKGSLSIDITDSNFDQGMAKIIQTINTN